MLLLAQEAPLLIEGAVVLEGLATVVKAAEMAVALKLSYRHSASAAAAFYAKASEGALADFLGSTATAATPTV